jgi:hypothetical protein
MCFYHYIKINSFMWQTLWNWVLLEKLKVTSLVKKLSYLVYNSRIHSRVHRITQLDLILSKMNPFRISFCLFNINFNIILSSTSMSPKLPLIFLFFDESFVCVDHLLFICSICLPPHPPWTDDCNSIGQQNKSCNSALCNFLHAIVTFSSV